MNAAADDNVHVSLIKICSIQKGAQFTFKDSRSKEALSSVADKEPEACSKRLLSKPQHEMYHTTVVYYWKLNYCSFALCFRSKDCADLNVLVLFHTPSLFLFAVCIFVTINLTS